MAIDNPGNPETAGGGRDKPPAEQHELILAINALGKKYEAAQSDQADHDRKSLRWSRAATIGVGIYTLLTAFIMWSSIESAKQARKSADYARQQLLATRDEQRAWIGPADVRIENGSPSFLIENSGNSPAMNFVLRIPRFELVAETGQPHPEFELDNEKTCFDKFTGFGEQHQTVFPKTKVPAYPIRDNGKLAQARRDEKKTLLMLGCLVYATFDKMRHTSFCFHFNAKNTPGKMIACTYGSRAD